MWSQLATTSRGALMAANILRSDRAERRIGFHTNED
jgi:hypothetical protein